MGNLDIDSAENHRERVKHLQLQTTAHSVNAAQCSLIIRFTYEVAKSLWRRQRGRGLVNIEPNKNQS